MAGFGVSVGLLRGGVLTAPALNVAALMTARPDQAMDAGLPRPLELGG